MMLCAAVARHANSQPAHHRHDTLFGAAFAVGVAAQAASAGVDRLIIASPTGSFGLLGPTEAPRRLPAVHAEHAAAARAQPTLQP